MKLLELFNSKGLREGSIGSFAIKLIGAVSSFAVSIFLGRQLGLQDYGVYVLAYSIMMLLTIPITLGTPILVTRYIPKYELEENYGAIKGMLIRARQYMIFSYIVVVLLCVGSYFIFREKLGTKIIETFGIALLLLPIIGYTEVKAAALNGLRLVIPGQLSTLFLRVFLFLILLLSYHFLVAEITVQMAMTLHVVAAYLSYLVVRRILRNRLTNDLRGVPVVFEQQQWFRESLHFAFIAGLNKLKPRVLKYILAIFGGLSSVALFEVAVKGANLLGFGMNAINTALAPHISRLHQKGSWTELQRIITKATRVSFIIALPLALFVFLAGEWAIQISYGKAFSGSFIPLLIMCAGQLINLFAGPAGLLLKMTGNQKFVVVFNSFNLLFIIMISFPLMYFYFTTGAALSYLLLLLIQNAVFVWYTNKKLNIRTTFLG